MFDGRHGRLDEEEMAKKKLNFEERKQAIIRKYNSYSPNPMSQ
jgi:hypothetical protein